MTQPNPASGRGRPYSALARGSQRVVTKLHGLLYAGTNGRLAGRLAGNQVVVLMTTGRRSGAERSAPLFAYTDGEDFLVVASNGGTAKHPDWYLNLAAQPDAELRVGPRRRPVRAQVLDPAEKARWWPTVVEHYRGYAGYQQATDRDIPMVRLSPR